MVRPLGNRQLALLRQLANPYLFLVVGDSVARSLEKRGLVAARSDSADALYQITPAGMRTIADAWQDGKIGFDLRAATSVNEGKSDAG